MALKEGERAPDFELKSDTGEMLRLSDELKKHEYVVLAFFPAAFSSVCTTEMNTFQEALQHLQEMGTNVIGVSSDNFYALRAFKEQNGLEFPLVSDFHPQGEVEAKYGVRGEDGTADRVLFLIGPDRTIYLVQDEGRVTNPGVDRVMDKLEELFGEGERWRATGTG